MYVYLAPSWNPDQGVDLTIKACKNVLNCNEILPRVFVTFAHLCYLKIILRLFVEGQAWVRVRVSRAVKESCEAGSMVTMVAAKFMCF